MKLNQTTVTISYFQDDIDTLKEAGREAVMQALGYLVTYGMWGGNPPHAINLKLYRDEILASYHGEPGESKTPFVMGAVWRQDEKRFTFHS